MNVSAGIVAALWVALAASTAADAGRVHTFDRDVPNRPPAGFVLAAMRQPDAGHWRVRRQARVGALVHDAARSADGYALAIEDRPAARPSALSARLRLEGGARAGGLVWRYTDDQNFDALVLDLARGTLALYRVRGGNRVRVEFEDDLELDPAGWHTLQVKLDDDATRAAIGGVRVFVHHTRERRPADRPSGRVGLIATGDSTVAFDDLRIETAREDHDR
jgi:hypothetical protein